ncbi:ABC transporter ATP-binding protein [Saccharopolyspora pogona]|uniref:ABC transporter ATP-binding protein n=1 Tax=Saccharopolyspora pogona TaxID=333966 RepID=UPI001682536D|nr:ABC transporter ATP-binding protein [Saccharopolyspora pogona]
MSEPLLELDRLSVRFLLGRGAEVRAVTDATLQLRPGRVLALVGESGCGKSVLASTLLGLLPGNAQVRGEAVLCGGIELLSAPEPVLAGQVRGRLVGLVPQSASTHLTPVRTARSQLVEAIRALGGAAGPDELAERVGLDPADLDRYPHELSGGMAQRVAVALALAGNPRIILADEPTTGLDRPLVHRTVDLLAQAATDDRAVLLITHDLAAARRVATDIAVMYASRIVEAGPAEQVLADPWHPYTARLLAALPDVGFRPIPGHPPALTELARIEQEWGCVFCQRCPDVPGFGPCTGDPELLDLGDRWVAAHPPC